MQTVNVDLFKNCVGFTLTMNRWGNRRRAKIDKVNITSKGNGEEQHHQPDMKLLRLSKVLIEADEYSKIVGHQGETRHRIEVMSVPSFFKKGICLIGNTSIEQVESFMARRLQEQNELVQKFCEVYPAKILDAENRLGDLFDSREYPMVNELPHLFAIKWNWIAFGVPDSLPQELFAAEKAKAEAQWAEATDQITLCLREGWKELVDHMVERLHVEPGEEKPKVFRDSLIGNITEFIDMFHSRNIVNDNQLATMVAQAKELMQGIKPNDIRKNSELRAHMTEQFAQMQAAVNQMIEDMPTRSFEFDTEAA